MTRRLWAAAFIVVTVIGLASRRYAWLFPAAWGKYPGDALWALAVFCALGFFLPQWTTGRLALCALLVSYADEFSQTYHAAWIDGIRSTAVGHLLLGSTFSWFDMLAYTVGVGVGAVSKAIFGRLRNRD